MKRLLVIFLGLFSLAYAQYSPTGSKTQFKNGIGLGSKDSSAFLANDSLALTIDRNNRLLWRNNGASGTWNVVARNSDTGYLSSFVRLQQPSGIFRQNGGLWVRDAVRLDSIRAGGSGGAGLYTNTGAQALGWGAGGSTEVTAYGFAGYNANRSSSYTVRSFTDKRYVDSSISAVSVAWGAITGSLNNQTDLRDTLAARVTLSTAQTITGRKIFTDSLFNSVLPMSTIPYIGVGGRFVGNINKLSFDTTQGFLAVNTGFPLSNIDARGSSSSTDAITFNGNRSVSSMNTNTTNGNVTEFALRSVNTLSQAYTGVALQGINNSHTAGGENSGFSLKTITAGTFAERLYIEGTTFRASAFAGGGSRYIVTDNSGNLTASATLLNALNLGRGLTGTIYNGSNGVNTNLDTTGRYTWTRTQQFIDSIKGADFEGFNYWSINPNGGGYFAENKFSWDNAGNISTRQIVSATTGVPVVVNSTNSNTGKVQFQDNGTTRGTIGASSTNAFTVLNSAGTTLSTVNNGTGLTNFTLTSGNNGQVLQLGRSAGSYTWGLGVRGSNSYFVFYDNGGAELADINVTTGAYTALSDSSLKKNIKDAQPALPILKQIKVREYDWKGNNAHEPFGVIAQELYKVAPTYVSLPDSANPKARWGVSKAELVPMLIKAVQEQQSKIESLEARLAKLEAILNKQ